MKKLDLYIQKHATLLFILLLAFVALCMVAAGNGAPTDPMLIMGSLSEGGLAALATGGALAFGMIGDTSLDLKEFEKKMQEAFAKMQDGIKRAQDQATNALEEVRKEGTLHTKTNENLTALSEANKKNAEALGELRTQVLELAQKIGKAPEGVPESEYKTMAEMVLGSEQWKRAPAAGRMEPVVIGNFHEHFKRMRAMEGKSTIINATGQNQPLVADQRVAGLIVPAEQRLYIRDLLPQARAGSNLIQFASEATFTNNARPQGDASPGGIEGEEFAESAMTFSLANAAVVTIGHHIPASRQVLSDAPMLQGHIGARLIYGLKLEEETEFLNGNGTAGKINGLCNQAAAFTGGATNQTILDTLLKALLQVSLSNYEASGFVLHPTDWYNAMMLKDTQGRYLFSDPQSMVAPRVWAKPVVPSQTMTSGKFLAGAFDLGAQIWDLEDATIRISENVGRQFVQNLVTILAEERTTLTVYRTTAFVYGNTSHAG